jgi:hypothetical protein
MLQNSGCKGAEDAPFEPARQQAMSVLRALIGRLGDAINASSGGLTKGGEPMRLRAALAFLAAGLPAGVAPAEPEALLQDGAYEVRVRLELPNLERWATTKTTTVCLPYRSGTNAPLPILSSNNPLAECPASNVERDGSMLRFDIVCEGRGAAWARAVYTLGPGGFEGRIAMVMGGKNMTMAEVQSGRRVGGCDPPGTPG